MPIEIFILFIIMFLLILSFTIEKIVNKASEKVWDENLKTFKEKEK